jgi:2',3'-cyclic-nucleotide 2'-phosphodiesterase/3'-nucleotidase
MKKSILSFTFIAINTLFYLQSANLFAQTVKIKIIETSDVHGAIYPYNFTENRESKNSLAQVHTYVEEERAKDNQEVILIDNGDILQGDPAVYYYNFEKTDTIHLLASVMNYMKYDVASIGNHDIETGHPVYDKFNDELNFPWLAANAVNTETIEPYFPPYYVTVKNGVKIAVLGLITPGIPNWLPKNIWSGMEFQDMILTAKKWVEIIKEKENPDVLIGLFHAGTDFTYDNQTADSPRNENASQLVAEQVPGFDIVFVGHDHHEWNYKVANSVGDSVLILGPASRANSITVATLNLSYNAAEKSWKKSIEGEVVNTKNILPDENFLSTFSIQFDDVKNYVSRPIGKFTKTISANESIFGNSSFVDLIHKIQLELTNADISFTAPLSMHSEISEGTVFVKDMFDLYRYENLLYTMELSGQEILDYLEYSYASWFNTMENSDDNLLQFEVDENGNLVLSKRSNAPMLKNRYYNFDSAEGINYIVDVSKPIGERVEVLSLDDCTEFKLDKTYKVAVNSYRGNGGGGHLIKGAGIPQEELTTRVLSSTEKDLRYYLMKWIEKEGTVVPVEIDNWLIIPEDWVNSAVERDYKLMFGEK